MQDYFFATHRPSTGETFNIIDRLPLQRETVLMDTSFVHRFLSHASYGASHRFLHNRERCQLLALTALYLSHKTHGHTRASLGSAFFSHLSRGLYLVQDVEDTEQQLLDTLLWQLCAPTSIQLVRDIL